MQVEALLVLAVILVSFNFSFFLCVIQVSVKRDGLSNGKLDKRARGQI